MDCRTPTIVLAETTGDTSRKIFDVWGQQPGVTFYALESAAENDGRTAAGGTPCRNEWETVVGTDRIDLMVGELEGLIRFLETTTGTGFPGEPSSAR